jgi:hypothetical protein
MARKPQWLEIKKHRSGGHEYEICTEAGELIGAGWTGGNQTDARKVATGRVYDAVIAFMMTLKTTK